MRILNNPNLSPYGWVLAAQLSYPEFSNKLRRLNYSFDVSNAFDDLNVSPYIDICHVTEIGNRVLAEIILKKMLKVMKH
jgi:hypothetical protein